MSALESQPVEPLPVRNRFTEAELELADRWVQLHGDPADWCEDTRLAYANTVANMRAAGEL